MPRVKSWIALKEIGDLIPEAAIWYKNEHGDCPRPPRTEPGHERPKLADEVTYVMPLLTRVSVVLGDGTILPISREHVEGPWSDGQNYHVDLALGTLGSGVVWEELERLGPPDVEAGLELRYGALAKQLVLVDVREADAAFQQRYGIGLDFARALLRHHQSRIARIDTEGEAVLDDPPHHPEPPLRSRDGAERALSPAQEAEFIQVFGEQCQSGVPPGSKEAFYQEVVDWVQREFGLKISPPTARRLVLRTTDQLATHGSENDS